MEYQSQPPASIKVKPRIVIHGGAGNIQRKSLPAETYQEYRSALLSIVGTSQLVSSACVKAHLANDFGTCQICSTNHYMLSGFSSEEKPKTFCAHVRSRSALEVATYAVVQLENNPLFNSGHGAVFTRDGINQLEASVMVSRGYKKRAVGVMGLRHVRNPILLARGILERGEGDLVTAASETSTPQAPGRLDVPSAQGHTQIYGEAAEQLAEQYGLDMVKPNYFFTQRRWDEHLRALEREASGSGVATWHADDYLPQGTCGAVALDENGVICAATSTGGMTNKLTGRVGDTPVPGAGFWAEEWTEAHPPGQWTWGRLQDMWTDQGPPVTVSGSLKGFLVDCLPTPFMYSPASLDDWLLGGGKCVTTRAVGASGTGNGDSFLRVDAVRTVAAMARWKPEPSSAAMAQVVGRNGELQKSAGERWGKTGEGEGGMIGIECTCVRNARGQVVAVRSDILMDYNCGGMYRAWIDSEGKPVMSVWSNGSPDEM